MAPSSFPPLPARVPPKGTSSIDRRASAFLRAPPDLPFLSISLCCCLRLCISGSKRSVEFLSFPGAGPSSAATVRACWASYARDATRSCSSLSSIFSAGMTWFFATVFLSLPCGPFPNCGPYALSPSRPAEWYRAPASLPWRAPFFRKNDGLYSPLKKAKPGFFLPDSVTACCNFAASIYLTSLDSLRVPAFFGLLSSFWFYC